MRVAVAAPIMAGALIFMPSCDQSSESSTVEASALSEPYFAMRDAQICAGLDPRTDADAMEREVKRTGAIIESGRRSGLGSAIDAFEKLWIDTDGYGDKICPFQSSRDIEKTEPSLSIYRAANDALEAAIAAEAQ